MTASTELRQLLRQRQAPDTAAASGGTRRGRTASTPPSTAAPSSTPLPKRARSSAERRSRGAVAAATRTQSPRRGRGRWRTVTADTATANGSATTARTQAAVRHSALRTTTGLALVAFGLILLWAVHATASTVNLHTAGLVLIVVGAAWLWMPVRDKRDLLRRLFDAAMTYVSFDGSDASSAGDEATSRPRCSLDDMLATQAEASLDVVSPLPCPLPGTGTLD